MKVFRITAEGGYFRLPCANCGTARVVNAVFMVGPDGKETIVCPPPVTPALSIQSLPADITVVANAPRVRPAPKARPRLTTRARGRR